MSLRVACGLIACAAVSIFPAWRVSADDCKLVRLASLDFTDSGSIIVPVTLEGHPVPMAIDTGSPISAVDPVVANRLGLIEQRIPEGFLYDVAGETFSYMALPHDFGLGDMHAKQEGLAIWPSRMTQYGSVGGTVSADILRHYDIDIDFGAHKLSLFSQDHCPGKIVYWTSGSVAIVPMHVRYPDGYIIIPVTLDDNAFHAILDTGSSETFLFGEAARNAFGLGPTSAGMSRASDHGGPGGVPVYRHRFKNLDLQGISFENPMINIFDNVAQSRAAPHLGSRFRSLGGEEYELTLGLNELRQFHLYIAYGEQKLYVTAASRATAMMASATPQPVSPASPVALDPGTRPLHHPRLRQPQFLGSPPVTSGIAAPH